MVLPGNDAIDCLHPPQEFPMAMETNLESQITFEGGMFLMVISKTGCSET